MTSFQNIKKSSDKELLELFKENGDNNILGELYQRHTQFVFLVSMKYLKNEERSKDAVMQIFEKLMTDLKEHDIANFKAWLHTVTRNHCLMKLRKDQTIHKKQEEYKKDTENFVEFEPVLHQEDKDPQEENEERLNNAIQQLKPEHKKCIELFYLKEKSYSDVAEETGYTLKQVKSYIQNGKRNLKNILMKSGYTSLAILYFWMM